jgi:uncharacterized small protein (TIGR04563 family)
MAKSDRASRYVNVYFPEGMIDEIKAEARRLDRSVMWLMRRVWLLARQDIRKLASPSGGSR